MLNKFNELLLSPLSEFTVYSIECSVMLKTEELVCDHHPVRCYEESLCIEVIF